MHPRSPRPERQRPAVSVDVYSDTVCPWCLIGARRLQLAGELLADELALEIRWRPFELNPEMPPEGMGRREYREAKFASLERSRELDAGTVEAGAGDGVSFRYDLIERTPNTFASHRLIWMAAGEGLDEDVAQRLLQAYFTEGRDVGDLDVLAEVAGEAGLERAATRDRLAGDEGEKEVRDAQQLARQRGVNAVPFFLLDDRYGLPGAQPPAVLAAALQEVANKAGGAGASSGGERWPSQ